MSRDSKRIENDLKEDTGVATVSQPDVGHNIQYPIGQSPDSYQKRNAKQQKLLSFKRWIDANRNLT